MKGEIGIEVMWLYQSHTVQWQSCDRIQVSWLQVPQYPVHLDHMSVLMKICMQIMNSSLATTSKHFSSGFSSTALEIARNFRENRQGFKLRLILDGCTMWAELVKWNPLNWLQLVSKLKRNFIVQWKSLSAEYSQSSICHSYRTEWNWGKCFVWNGHLLSSRVDKNGWIFFF